MPPPEMTALTASRAPRATDSAGSAAKSVPPAATSQRLTTLTARFEDLDLPPASFDLISSCMSLHHVQDKAALYHSFVRWLAPGGHLAFADQLLGATPHIHATHWDLWLTFCRQPAHCSPEELQSLIDHVTAHDHYTPLPEHFAMLAAAGFTHPDCAWRNGMYTVMTAEAAPRIPS
ncbi:MAG: methyltransferase domain-containing protein [Phycisphaerales bacterium]